jgi:hypothetical protein
MEISWCNWVGFNFLSERFQVRFPPDTVFFHSFFENRKNRENLSFFDVLFVWRAKSRKGS